MPTITALAGGAFIFLAFIIIFVVVLGYSYYSKMGSGIEMRPTDGRGEAAGAEGASSITTTRGDGDERTIGTHGTE